MSFGSENWVIARLDAIGDLVLCFPALKFLRQAGPDKNLVLLVDSKNGFLGEWALENSLCTRFCLVDTHGKIQDQVSFKNAQGFLALSWDPRLPKLISQVQPMYSFGPRSKLPSLWTFSKSLKQKRSRVEKSEMQYNVDLARFFLEELKIPVPQFEGVKALRVDKNWIPNPRMKPYSVVVVSNRGSAQNLPMSFYLDLIECELNKFPELDIVILANGWDSQKRIQEFRKSSLANHPRISLVESFSNPRELVGFLSEARKVFSSSTGPIHLAHAAGVSVIGYYPMRKVESFRRWRPDGFWHAGRVEFFEFSEKNFRVS